MPLGMTEEEIARLVQIGQLERSFLDRVYLDTKQDEFETDVEPVARELAQKIATDPQAAAIAKRTEDLVKGQSSPTPAPLPTPNPNIQTRTSTPTTAPQATIQNTVRTGNPASANPDEIVTAELGSLSQASKAAESGQKEDTLANMERAFRLQQMGIMAEADATARGNAQVAALNTDLANRLGSEADKARTERQKTEVDRDAQIAKLKRMDEEFSSMKIDPNRFWATRTTEQKIWAAIGIGLSAFGSSAGGGNKALQVIDAAIDKDIEMQKAAIELKKGQIGVSRNVLSDMLDVAKDKDAAENMARAAMIQQVNLQIGATNARTNSEIAKASGMKLMGELEQKRQEYLTKALSNDSLDRQVAARVAFEQNQDVPVIQSPEDINKYLDKDAISSKVPGVGWATDPTQKKDVIEAVKAYNTIQSGLSRIIQLRQEVGTELQPFSAERAAAGAVRAEVFSAVRLLEKMGALDAGVEKNLAPILKDDPLGPYSADYATMGATALAREVGALSDPLIAGAQEYKNRTKEMFYKNIKYRLAGVTPQFDKEMKAGDTSKTVSLKEAGTKVKE